MHVHLCVEHCYTEDDHVVVVGSTIQGTPISIGAAYVLMRDGTRYDRAVVGVSKMVTNDPKRPWWVCPMGVHLSGTKLVPVGAWVYMGEAPYFYEDNEEWTHR